MNAHLPRTLLDHCTLPSFNMSEVKKQEKDFTPEVEVLVKEATELAKASFKLR